MPKIGSIISRNDLPIRLPAAATGDQIESRINPDLPVIDVLKRFTDQTATVAQTDSERPDSIAAQGRSTPDSG